MSTSWCGWPDPRLPPIEKWRRSCFVRVMFEGTCQKLGMPCSGSWKTPNPEYGKLRGTLWKMEEASRIRDWKRSPLGCSCMTEAGLSGDWQPRSAPLRRRAKHMSKGLRPNIVQFGAGATSVAPRTFPSSKISSRSSQPTPYPGRQMHAPIAVKTGPPNPPQPRTGRAAMCPQEPVQTIQLR